MIKEQGNKAQIKNTATLIAELYQLNRIENEKHDVE